MPSTKPAIRLTLHALRRRRGVTMVAQRPEPKGLADRIIRMVLWPIQDDSRRIRSGWLVFSFTLGFLLLVGCGMVAFKGAGPRLQQPLSVGAVLVMTWLYTRREGKSLAWVGLCPTRRAFWVDLLLGALAGAGLVALATVGLWLSGAWRLSLTPAWGPMAASAKWIYALVTIGFLGMVSFQEELLCRGYPLAILRSRVERDIAILATSATFAFLHIWNPGVEGMPGAIAILNIGLAGGLLAYVTTQRGSLGAAFGFHATWNLAQVLSGSAVSGNMIAGPVVLHMNSQKPMWLIGGPMGFEGSLACTLVLVLAILGAARWLPGELRQ